MGLQFAIVDPHHDGTVFCLIISTCVFILKLQETIVKSNSGYLQVTQPSTPQ